MSATAIQDGVLTLGESLDIAHAAGLKADLTELLGQDKDPAIDASHVIRSDASGLQVLLAFAEHCRTNERSWRWQAVSEVLRNDAAGLGLARQLDINPQPKEGGQ